MTKLVCISDTHNHHDKIDLPEGDVLIHSGDFTNGGSALEIETFLRWYGDLDYKYKILVAGNHDWGFDTDREVHEKLARDLGIIYLNDKGVTLDGIKFWGSPVQPEFCDWAFNRRIEEDDISRYDWIKPHWDMIPDGTDVLITHGPPMGVLDVSIYDGKNCGCPHLLEKVCEVKPKVHIFGHIHHWHGTCSRYGIKFINASTCNERYDPVNEPIEVKVKK